MERGGEAFGGAPPRGGRRRCPPRPSALALGIFPDLRRLFSPAVAGFFRLAACAGFAAFSCSSSDARGNPSDSPWEWAVLQRNVCGFKHTWIEGRNRSTGERVTYSGSTPDATGGLFFGNVFSGGGPSGASASAGAISGKEGRLNMYRNYAGDYNADAWGGENGVRLSAPAGKNGDDMARELALLFGSYRQDSISYGACALGFGEYNCNSLTATLLEKLGFTAGQISGIFDRLPGNHWGWNTRLPDSAFVRSGGLP